METYKFSRQEMIKLLSGNGCKSCPIEEECKKADCGCFMEQQAAELLKSDVEFINEQTKAIAIMLSQSDGEAESDEPGTSSVPVKHHKPKVFIDKPCREVTDAGIVTHPVSFSVSFVGETPFTMEDFIMKRVPAGLPCDAFNRCFVCDEVNLLEEKPFHVVVDGLGDRFICPRCAHKYFKC